MSQNTNKINDSFIRIGDIYINLNNVTHITPSRSTIEDYYTIYFTDGKSETVTAETIIELFDSIRK